MASSGWRPSQWSQPALTTMTVAAQAGPGTYGLNIPSAADPTGSALPGAPAYTPPPGSQPTVYVFDAVFRLVHDERNQITENPIQTGAAINPHAYEMPTRIQLEIGMSDAMQSYTASNWTGNASKSVAAYQVLLSLKAQRVLVTLTTRLKTYENVMIESIEATDTYETRYGLRAIVTFKRIVLATVPRSNNSNTGSSSGSPPISARPQTTNSTAVGKVQAIQPSPVLMQQHTVPAAQQNPNVPGAGNISSNNVSQLMTSPASANPTASQPPFGGIP